MCKHENVFFEFDDYDLLSFICVDCSVDLDIVLIGKGEFKSVRINETVYRRDDEPQ